MKKVIYIILYIFIFQINAFSLGILKCNYKPWICVPPPPRPPVVLPEKRVRKKPYIKEAEIKIDVIEQVAHVKIKQRFYNPNSFRIEGTFMFPLPADSNLTKFYFYIDGKKHKGELMDIKKARKIYEDIVRTLADPALVEYFDWNLLKMQIFPIPAYKSRTIELQYVQTLKKKGAVIELEYPLTFALKKKIEILNIKVNLKSRFPIKTVYSPTFKIKKELITEKYYKVSYEKEDFLPENNFKLYFSASEKDIDMNLLTYKEKDDTEGFFIMFISPKYKFKQDMILPKDVVLVIDKSGSMLKGNKMVQAKEAMRFIINNLASKDRFGIVTFSSSAEKFKKKLEKASEENKKKAVKFINEIEAGGGTNIADAYDCAFELYDKKDRPFFVIFLTDGRPTVGDTKISEILKRIKRKFADNIRVFAFGIGSDVNTHLLRRIAEKFRGTDEYVESNESIEEKISLFYKKISKPVLSSPQITVEGIKIFDVVPDRIPDIFAGTQIQVFGKFKNTGDAKIILTGKVQGKKTQLVFNKKFENNFENNYIPELWATRKIAFLLENYRLNKEAELKEEILKLSKKYGIITPFTGIIVAPDEYDVRSPVPILQDTGKIFEMKKEKVFYQALKTNAIQMSADSYHASRGSMAVKSARYLNQLSATTSMESIKNLTGIKKKLVKVVGKRVFYKIDGIFQDSRIKGDEKTKIRIKMFSKAYFDILKKYTYLKKYFKLGKVAVLFKPDIVIIVADKGITTFSDQEKKVLNIPD